MADVVKLGELEVAQLKVYLYIKELAPNHNLQIEEGVIAKGIDILTPVIVGNNSQVIAKVDKQHVQKVILIKSIQRL